jgi:hypothetical protein
MSSDILIKANKWINNSLELCIRANGIEIVSFGEASLENYELDGPIICHQFIRGNVEDREALERLSDILEHQLTIWDSLEENEE